MLEFLEDHPNKKNLKLLEDEVENEFQKFASEYTKKMKEKAEEKDVATKKIQESSSSKSGVEIDGVEFEKEEIEPEKLEKRKKKPSKKVTNALKSTISQKKEQETEEKRRVQESQENANNLSLKLDESLKNTSKELEEKYGIIMSSSRNDKKNTSGKPVSDLEKKYLNEEAILQNLEIFNEGNIEIDENGNLSSVWENFGNGETEFSKIDFTGLSLHSSSHSGSNYTSHLNYSGNRRSVFYNKRDSIVSQNTAHTEKLLAELRNRTLGIKPENENAAETVDRDLKFISEFCAFFIPHQFFFQQKCSNF